MTASRTRLVSRRTAIGGGLALLAGLGSGTAWALDRFVIEHAEVSGVSAEPTSTSTGESTLTETSFSNDLVSLTLTDHKSGSGNDALAWFVADLKLTDATALRSAFAKDTFGENIIEVPSAIASRVGAVWAVNGDYYGFRDSGIVVRNGRSFRDRGARKGLAITRDGEMVVYDETATSAAKLIDDGVWHTLSFGPPVVEDGKVVSGIDTIEVDTNFGNHSIQGDQPRTALGMVEAGHFVVVVVDGRSTGYSRGVGLTELAQMLLDLEVKVGYNLDGGGSSVMVFNDSLVNNPLGRSTERGTSDVLYLAR